MSEPTDPLAWVQRAEEDYAIAAASVRRKQPWTYGACFHAQQCAEKYLKAILVAHGRSSRRFMIFWRSTRCACKLAS
jgi:HEPN domain-containing protein